VTKRAIILHDNLSALLQPPVIASFIMATVLNATESPEGQQFQTSSSNVLNGQIESLFQIVLEYDFRSIVLGPFGCGYYANNPETIAGLFKLYIYTQRYCHHFENVTIAMS
jgi:uncharacterized protein (TIGR02452 family)